MFHKSGTELLSQSSGQTQQRFLKSLHVYEILSGVIDPPDEQQLQLLQFLSRSIPEVFKNKFERELQRVFETGP
jgi:hypothetical protein